MTRAAENLFPVIILGLNNVISVTMHPPVISDGVRTWSKACFMTSDRSEMVTISFV